MTTIVGTLPNNIQNGQLEDATPLMANFNFIVNQINANGNPAGTLTAPSGTVMAFQQAAAPLGWVANTTADGAYDDAFLHCVIPANFVGSAGTVAASTLITGPITGDGHALVIAELASHTHIDEGHDHDITDPTHAHALGGSYLNFGQGAVSAVLTQSGNTTTANVATGVTVDPGAANLSNTGSGTAHSHTLTAACKFIDQIVAVKS